ncbi:MAG TPA: CHRD domain-containing protein [Flavisolibacter sp.]|jgi:hypothetical protein|nr:CHRD domain-containing protein [Flavisolibacter sp.]
MKKIRLSLLALVFLGACQKEARNVDNSDEQALPQVRGQEAAQRGGRPFVVILTGAQEAPGPGDPDGSGIAELYLNQGQGTISYKITVSGIAEVTGAHIHKAPVGEAGPIVVPLTAVADGTVTGEAKVEPELIKDIRQNPGAYYVNVHSVEYRPGAVRGQLSK